MMVPHATMPAPTAKNSGYVTGWTHLKLRFPALDIALSCTLPLLRPASGLTSVPVVRPEEGRQLDSAKGARFGGSKLRVSLSSPGGAWRRCEVLGRWAQENTGGLSVLGGSDCWHGSEDSRAVHCATALVSKQTASLYFVVGGTFAGKRLCVEQLSCQT
jgi:hypothetical protein